jgi:aminoglycoside phosphotransferase (APT) family kinase protein
MARIVSALARLADVATPSPVALARDHPRLGGWTDVVRDDASMRRLPAESRWAVDHLALLVELERDGLEAARGESLVHFDLYPHNVLLSADRVSFVDWPHARLGNPLVDLVSVLSTVAVTGHDPSPIAQAHPLMRKADPHVLDALIAAHAGFCIAGALSPAAPGLDAVVDAKRALAGAFLGWLAHRSPSAA